MLESDTIWQAFAETGDPVYYLLYKSAGGNTGKKEERKDGGAGESPSAEA